MYLSVIIPVTVVRLKVRVHSVDYPTVPCQWCVAGPGQDAGWHLMTILLWKPWTWCGPSAEATPHILLWWDMSWCIQTSRRLMAACLTLRFPTDNWPKDAPGRSVPQRRPNSCPPLGCVETRGANDPGGPGAPLPGPLLWQQEDMVSACCIHLFWFVLTDFFFEKSWNTIKNKTDISKFLMFSVCKQAVLW